MWEICYHPEAKKELIELDGSQQKIVLKAIIKVSKNPESNIKGGYGKPLGNKAGNNLTGLFKIKLVVSVHLAQFNFYSHLYLKRG